MYIPLLVQPAQVTAVIYKVKIVAAAASVCHTVLVDSKGKYSLTVTMNIFVVA